MAQQLQLSILFSTWSHGSDARKEHDLRKNRWQEDKVHRTVRLDGRAPQTNGSRSEAMGAARSEQLGGGQDLQQGLAMETFASSDRTVRPAREETTGTGSTRHADRSINSSMSASRGAH